MEIWEIKIYTFDLDENLFFCWEKIFLWDKVNNKEIWVLQDEFYHLIQQKDLYWFVNDDIEVSMRNFRKWDGYLAKQLVETYKENKLWPSFEIFLKALNNGSPISIITARGHSVEEFEFAFSTLFWLLREKWELKEDSSPNIIFQPVSNKDFCAKIWIDWYLEASEKKALCFEKFLRETIAKIRKEYRERWEKTPYISIWFSDDSRWNVLKMMDYVLSNNGNWKLKTQPIEYNFIDTSNEKPQNLKFNWKML